MGGGGDANSTNATTSNADAAQDSKNAASEATDALNAVADVLSALTSGGLALQPDDCEAVAGLVDLTIAAAMASMVRGLSRRPYLLLPPHTLTPLAHPHTPLTHPHTHSPPLTHTHPPLTRRRYLLFTPLHPFPCAQTAPEPEASTEPPSPPTAPVSAAQGEEDEAAAKAKAAKEKKEAANAGNAAADAVAKVLDSLGQGLTNGLSPGDPPAVIKSAAFTMSVEKAVMPDFGSGEDGGAAAEEMAVGALADMDMGPAPDEGEEAGSGPAPPEADPKALFFPVSNAVVDKMANIAANPNAAPIFIVPPGFVAGQEEVDVQLLTYKVTSRSPPPPPESEVGLPGETEQETSSAVTAMTLRSGAPPLAPP